MDKYTEWIKEYKGSIFRKCVEVTEEMQKKFPELTFVIGHVRTCENPCKEVPHQWLETKEGEIIDPTKKQWFGIMEYNKYNEGNLIPVGICVNCGEQIYGLPHSTASLLCSDECNKEYMEYLNDSLGR